MEPNQWRITSSASTRADQDIPGYRIIDEITPNNDCVECACGWRSGAYHGMTSYAHHEWLAHVRAHQKIDKPTGWSE
jgi:hypothetical protein